MAKVPDYFYKQSAVIPYQIRGDELDILLVTSRGKRRWIIPKGVIEPGMTAQQSAANEALEEAGVKGDVSNKSLGTYTYKKWGGTCEVQVFAMEVKKIKKTWEEDFRDRVWVSLPEAIDRLKGKDLKKIVKKLSALLEQIGDK